MKEIKDWIRDFKSGRISRRDFVERAATGGLSLLATTSILSAKAHAEGRGGEINHQHNHSHDHHHHHGAQRSSSRQRTWDQTNVNPWEEWLKQENLPLHKDYYVSDLRKAEVKQWKSLGPGENGAYIDLIGGEGVNVGYLCELAPRAKTEPQRYLFEEVLYVLNGEGESLIWQPGSKNKQSVRWKAGSVLAPPLNVWRQHLNRGKTLMWKGSLKYSDEPPATQKRIDWVEGSLFVPPDGWFHQHFNAGHEPARYIAPTWGGDGKWFMRALGGGGRTHRLGKTSTRKGGNLIEYEDEDPAIREMFVAELKKNGVEVRMPKKKEK